MCGAATTLELKSQTTCRETKIYFYGDDDGHWFAVFATSGLETSLKDFRRDIIIDLFDEGGQVVLSYHLFNCWVSEYQALPDLDANANAVAIQHLKLECEGWVRDPNLPPPADSQFDDPTA